MIFITDPTRVICIMNMIDPEDIPDIDASFMTELTEDFARYGTILSLRIPKPPLTETGKVISCLRNSNY